MYERVASVCVCVRSLEQDQRSSYGGSGGLMLYCCQKQ